MYDAKQLTRADSPSSCLPEDNAHQFIKMTNTVYDQDVVIEGTPHHGFIVNLLGTYTRTDLAIIYEGNTMKNIDRTFYRALILEGDNAEITVTNNTWMNVTSGVDVAQLKTTKSVIMSSTILNEVSSTS